MTTLRKYVGYTINRSRIEGKVLFGCGNVAVVKEDLHKYADAIEKIPGFAKYCEFLNDRSITINSSSVIIPLNELSRVSTLKKMLQTPGFNEAIMAVNNLRTASSGYSHRFNLYEMTPHLLRSIAGKRKTQRNVKGKA